MNTYRIDIIPKIDSKIRENLQFKNDFNHAQIIKKGKVYWLSTNENLENFDLNYIASEILSTKSVEDYYLNDQRVKVDCHQIIECSLKTGVRDNRAQSSLDAIKIFYPNLSLKISTGDTYFIQGDVTLKELEDFSLKNLINPMINCFHVMLLEDFQCKGLKKKNQSTKRVKEELKIINLDTSDQELLKLSRERCLSLSLQEMKIIQNYVQCSSSKRDHLSSGLITDVEIEILAQTWSEHCKHKIFGSKITYCESDDHQYKLFGDLEVDSLYKQYIKATTKKLAKPWAISVFSDNSGVVRFDEKYDLCIKVETHNSPCALDPYGGALTGILGVNRDIMGTGLGAKTIANMDVFCTGNPNKSYQLPAKLIHPQRLLSEIHRGVKDGGNKSGIPTVNGSMHFHNNWIGKPLVYVGSVGIIPQRLEKYDCLPTDKKQKNGDLIVICGGRVGADGIHGATFSSMELNDEAQSTFVQIGDPYTQRKLSEFILEARDRGLFTSITDNGAGGLSSSIGEMAQVTNGAKVTLENALLKYEGLADYEIMISESQERMTLSVEKTKFEELNKLAKTHEVEVCIMGEFNNSGFLEIYHHEKLVAKLDMDFLHNGLAQLELKATFDPSSNPYHLWHEDSQHEYKEELKYLFKNILTHPNIASKQRWIREYDHEVKAQTLAKPYNGKTQNAPSDAAVIDLSVHGGSSLISISNGLDSLHSQYDCYTSSMVAIHEALSNLMASGADYDHIALLDNFCWPDPIKSLDNPDGEHKLAQLVRANIALKECCLKYETPLVSGKDSMKNDYIGLDANQKKTKISSLPTLLISGMSKNSKVVPNHFITSDENVFIVGNLSKDIFHSHLSVIHELKMDYKAHPIDLDINKLVYQTVSKTSHLFSSCHDISEGGLITALFEMCLGNSIGFDSHKSLSIGQLFNEPTACFIISLHNKNKDEFEDAFKKIPHVFLGKTTEVSMMNINNEVFNIRDFNELYQGVFND